MSFLRATVGILRLSCIPTQTRENSALSAVMSCLRASVGILRSCPQGLTLRGEICSSLSPPLMNICKKGGTQVKKHNVTVTLRTDIHCISVCSPPKLFNYPKQYNIAFVCNVWKCCLANCNKWRSRPKLLCVIHLECFSINRRNIGKI